MNRPALSLILVCLCFSVYSQQVEDSSFKKTVFQKLSEIQPPTGPTRTVQAPKPPSLNIPAGYFQKEGAAKLALLKQWAETGTPGRGTYNSPVARMNATCEDTSFSRLLGIENSFVYINSVTKSRDGNLLVTGEMNDTLAANPFRITYGYLMKIDEAGEILWVKTFGESNPNYAAIYYTKAHELSNGDIIFSALRTIDGSGNLIQSLLLRLTSTGNVIWQTALRSNLTIPHVPKGYFRFVIETVEEGLNGELIVAGTTTFNTSYGAMGTVAKLTGQGHLVWDANFGNYGTDPSYKLGVAGVAAYLHNGQIRFVCLNGGTSNSAAYPTITFLTLDYNNANQLAARFFKSQYADVNTQLSKSFGFGRYKITRLNNGNVTFYGKLFSEGFLRPFKEYFGVVEFDGNLNLLRSYTIGSYVSTNTYNNLLQIDPSGKGFVTAFEILGGFTYNVHFASFENMQFLKQRKIYYTAGLGQTNGVAFLSDNGYAYMQLHYIPSPAKSYLEFTKMHDSDTSSDCLGYDTLIFEFTPLNIVETQESAFLDPNWPDTLEEFSMTVLQQDKTGHFINRCKQSNICDTVKIHGESSICNDQAYVDFTAYKKSVCGGIVQWNIDPSAIDSMRVLSDSSVRMYFRNINWKGKLYAMLPAGACFLPALDSMELSIIRTPEPIDLGPDTVLCTQNMITFHAGHTFDDYLWQDGSTDSTLTVSTAGKYWVTAHDGCGNEFTDTVNVTPFQVNVYAGPDRNICLNDSVRLEAPDGFINYTWTFRNSPNSIDEQRTILFFMQSQQVYLAAEKRAGCFAYDTIDVQVLSAPAIRLGADTSFCSGDSIVLHAGNGFNSYTWSNGSSGQQITVHSSGEYSVTGVHTNGCKSMDTLRVLPLFPKPVVALDDNPELCIGTTRTLHAGNFASYLWHDGSTTASVEVSGTGTYYVTVEDMNECVASDTVRITQILPLPANFLPGDTSICNYANLLLRPQGNYDEYLWSTNATGVSITVTQPGEYWLRVTDSHDCTGADTILILPKECLVGLYAPNAFSPNNDGWNDTFRPIVGGTVESYELTIYNRYGQRIYSSKDLHRGWDGTIGGIKQDSNTFAWTCRYKLEGQPERMERGTVTLVR